MATEKRFDVVVYEIDSRKIDHFAGRDMKEEGSFHTVDKRIATVSERLNDRYDVMAVEAGKYKVGDVLPEEP